MSTMNVAPAKRRLQQNFFADRDELAQRLGAADCGDALIGVGRPGHIGLEFTRNAASMDEAIEAARVDVTAAIPAALLIG